MQMLNWRSTNISSKQNSQQPYIFDVSRLISDFCESHISQVAL